jgi:hypothetical protein
VVVVAVVEIVVDAVTAVVIIDTVVAVVVGVVDVVVVNVCRRSCCYGLDVVLLLSVVGWGCGKLFVFSLLLLLLILSLWSSVLVLLL